ncbi:hypothetical protein Trydic_g1762 [Trypoxylus dichotomus]
MHRPKFTMDGYEIDNEGIMPPLNRCEHFCADNQVLNTTNVENSKKNEGSGGDLGDCLSLKRGKLAEKPVLVIYSPEAETKLHCDVSTREYGSILLQCQTDNKMHPILYFSKRTTDAESKYSSYELECLAIVNSLKRFYVYLLGIKFKILTDCDSLRLTLSKKDIVPRIMGWVVYLQNFHYVVEHRPGKRMAHVDALSRAHVLILEENTFEQILGLKQTTDPKIKEIKLLIRELPFYELRNEMVFRKDKEKLIFYVPEGIEQSVIRTSH